jgi:transaldolase
MKYLFADTANLVDIKKLASFGIIQGVTTNPSLIAKEPKQNFDEMTEELWKFCADNNLPLSVEVFSDKVDEIIRQAKDISSKLLGVKNQNKLLYIKVPIGVKEISAIYQLAQAKISVNCTCCYTAEQMQLAAAAGAKYVSIFYNRLKDIGGDPCAEISKVKAFINDNKLDCQIIAGSIRKTTDLSEAWLSGCDIVTCSPDIINNSLFHEKSKESSDQFLIDFKAWIE